jgi:hypothetical protein
MVYAVDLVSQGRRAAAQIDEILRGANPAEIRFSLVDKYELIINLKEGAWPRNSSDAACAGGRSARMISGMSAVGTFPKNGLAPERSVPRVNQTKSPPARIDEIDPSRTFSDPFRCAARHCSHPTIC